MPGVSLFGVASKGTVTSFRFGFDLPGLDILLLPSCLPSLLRFMLPGLIATMKALTAVYGRFVNGFASLSLLRSISMLIDGDRALTFRVPN